MRLPARLPRFLLPRRLLAPLRRPVPLEPHPIAEAPASTTAFVGRTWRGPVDVPVPVASLADFERRFGGLWDESTLGHAVRQFFANGGGRAVVVRVAARGGPEAAAPAAFSGFDGGLRFEAADPGSWGMNLEVATSAPEEGNADLFHLFVRDDPKSRHDSRARGGSGLSEAFRNVSVDPANPRYVRNVLERGSRLLRLASDAADPGRGPGGFSASADAGSGRDGRAIQDADLLGDPVAGTGLHALNGAEGFGLLCIPPLTPGPAGRDVGTDVWQAAAALCSGLRSFLIVDAPQDWTVDGAESGVTAFAALERDHAALYFPRVLLPDPLEAGRTAAFAPCGSIAGTIARLDAAAGVWKAPAGAGAVLAGVSGLAVAGAPAGLEDADSERLEPLGINTLRVLPAAECVIWGARTLAGDAGADPEWKYVPVRRLALFLEQSIRRGTEWAVFEPNGEPLWSRLRADVGAFLEGLYRRGAFPGSKPDEGYFVRCGADTTTQADVAAGRIQLLVGFAPLRPAEFVVLRLTLAARPA